MLIGFAQQRDKLAFIVHATVGMGLAPSVGEAALEPGPIIRKLGRFVNFHRVYCEGLKSNCKIQTFLRTFIFGGAVLSMDIYSANWCLSECHCREGALLLTSASAEAVEGSFHKSVGRIPSI